MRITFARLRSLLAASCLVAAGLSPAGALAETRTAAALTPEAVWKAIDAAKDGDTVQLPAGTAVWTKGWNTGHGAKMKAITIQGAGMDRTVILDGRTSQGNGTVPFWLAGVEGKPFRVTGITFDGTGYRSFDGPGYRNAGYWGGLMFIEGTCKNFRIDHCKFKNAERMIQIVGDTCGLFDQCLFHAMEYHGGNAQTVFYEGPGIANYRKPLSLGTAEAVYFEDNEAHFSPEVVNPTGNNPWFVPYNGARTVIRHNKLINTQLEIYRPGLPRGFTEARVSRSTTIRSRQSA